MKNAAPFLLLTLGALVNQGCGRAEAQTVKTSDEPGRGPIELTVYADDFGMVRETRHVDLQAGRARVGLTGVSKSLDQQSVMFSWPKSSDAKVVSSTYDLGVGNSGRLLQRFLGKPVDLVYRGQDGREGERIRGVLEVAEPGNVVVRTEGKYVVNPNATIEAPADAGIVAIPQLSAEVESGKGGSTDLGVSYMTNGLSWNADYTLTLAPEGKTLGLECWATVTNRTGTDFPDAKITFVAGSPNRAVRNRGQLQEFDMNAGALARPESQKAAMNSAFREPEAMGELYAYPYKSNATIKQDQMNRVRMMGSEGVGVKRVYSIVLPPVYRDYAEFNANPDHRITATMGINFVNSKGAGLGLPLPAGAVRVYEPDATGAARYVGAASIGDTPKDARVSLELTNAFDVYARAKQISVQKIDKKHVRRTVEVTVSNEKTKPTEVRLVQNLGTVWKIDSQSIKGIKTNSAENQWTLNVPAGGEAKLKYSVILGA